MSSPFPPYGTTKLAAEHLCGLYYGNFGVNTVTCGASRCTARGSRPTWIRLVIRNTGADTSRARRDLGYVARTTFVEVLRSEFEWVRQGEAAVAASA